MEGCQCTHTEEREHNVELAELILAYIYVILISMKGDIALKVPKFVYPIPK